MIEPGKQGRRAKVSGAHDRADSPGEGREVGQRSPGHRSNAGSNYGDYVPSRSQQGMQRGGQERNDVVPADTTRADEGRDNSSAASSEIPWQGGVDEGESGSDGA
jgi:hypothetical protein